LQKPALVRAKVQTLTELRSSTAIGHSVWIKQTCAKVVQTVFNHFLDGVAASLKNLGSK
jgi:hypothetical protein